MTALVWLHEDAMRQNHPVYSAAGEDAISYFFWDEDYLKQMDYGFKRLVFIYETLCELPVTIIHDSTLEGLIRVAENHGYEIIYIPATPNPLLKKITTELKRRMPVIIVDDNPFVSLSKEPDIKRFFRYWNNAKKLAMNSQTDDMKTVLQRNDT